MWIRNATQTSMFGNKWSPSKAKYAQFLWEPKYVKKVQEKQIYDSTTGWITISLQIPYIIQMLKG